MATYLVLNLLTALLLFPVILFAKIQWRRAAKALLILFILTAVFDPVLVSSHIVSYNPRSILGLRVFGAPIEDFFYALVAAFLVPAIWHILERRRE